jgi:hypothetical protein
VTEPQPIWRLLRHLRDLLIEADWNGDAGLAAGLRQQITRLEMLQSYGETHDVDH